MFPFFTDAVTIGISHPSFEFSLVADGVPDLIDAVKIIDSIGANMTVIRALSKNGNDVA